MMKKKVVIITEVHQDINTAKDPDMIGMVARVIMMAAHHMNMLTANMKAKMRGHRGLLQGISLIRLGEKIFGAQF